MTACQSTLSCHLDIVILTHDICYHTFLNFQFRTTGRVTEPLDGADDTVGNLWEGVEAHER